MYECSKKGCNSQDPFDSNVIKHERWFCTKGQKNCTWGCNKKIKNTSLWQHYFDHCEFHNPVNDFTVTSETMEWHFGVLYGYDTYFLYLYKLTESNLHVFVVSNKSAENAQNYQVIVELAHDETGLYLQKQLTANGWQDDTIHYDFTCNANGNYSEFINGDQFEIRIQILPDCKNCCLQVNIPELTYSKLVNINQYTYCSHGCSYQDIRPNQLKHEKWLCKRSESECNWECGETLYNISLFNHFRTYFDIQQLDMYNRVIQYDNNLDEQYGMAIKAYGANFICRYQLTEENIHVYVVSNLKAEFLKNFTIELLIFHRDSDFFYSNELNVNSWENKKKHWDYIYDGAVNPCSFNSLINYDNTYDFYLYIYRVCKDCL